MRQTSTIAKALADESRLRALMAVRSDELCLCQLIELLGSAPSTVSKHLAILHAAGLVERRKEGRWTYYRLAGETAPRAVRQAIAWALETLEASPVVAQDDKEVARVRDCELEELSACYRS